MRRRGRSATQRRSASSPDSRFHRLSDGASPALVDALYEAVLRWPVPIVVYAAMPLGRFPKTWISDNVERMTGFEASDFLHRPGLWLSRVHAKDRALVQKAFREAARAETGVVEYRWRTADGTYRWFLDAITGHRAGRSGAPRLIGVWIDITKRKLAEEARQRIEAQLRQSLEERARLARDLHDDIIQSFYAVGLNLGECRQVLTAQPRRAQQLLNHAATEFNAVLQDLRLYVAGLEPESLQGQSLRTAMRSLAAGMNATGLIHWDVAVDAEVPRLLSPMERLSFIQIAKEAMSNSLRHARAQHGLISVRRNEGVPTLLIEDDGVGFDVRTIRDHPGRGLHNIRARARQLAAHLRVESRLGGGTRVMLRLPVKTR